MKECNRLEEINKELLSVLQQIITDYHLYFENGDGDLLDERMSANLIDAEDVIAKAERS